MTDRQTLDALRMDGAFFPYEVRALRTISGAIGHHRADMRAMCANLLRNVKHRFSGEEYAVITALIRTMDDLE